MGGSAILSSLATVVALGIASPGKAGEAPPFTDYCERL